MITNKEIRMANLRRRQQLFQRVWLRKCPLPVVTLVLAIGAALLVVLFFINNALMRHSSISTTANSITSIDEDRYHEVDARSPRAHYDRKQQLDWSVVESIVEEMRRYNTKEAIGTMDTNYPLQECPPTIPDGYPQTWNIIDVLENWNPDNTTIPTKIHQGLCALDWRDPNQRIVAQTYRDAELPFLIHHNPEVWKLTERWSHKDYLEVLLGSEEYKNEFSKNNHMMYWKLRGRQKGPEGWKPPTELRKQTFAEWYEKATELEQATTTTAMSLSDVATQEHWYFRVNAKGKNPDENFIYNEIPFFYPQKSFFMVDPDDARGVNCRFGSKGIIAETHYDYSRNFILIAKGMKRYVVAHPNQCSNMELYPQGHPSARHSRVNWSDPDDWQTGSFSNARVNEVILQAGDILYLPTAWFHFIVSLNMNYQCNARSGTTHENDHEILRCGFHAGR